jgi:hypothetical protein
MAGISLIPITITDESTLHRITPSLSHQMIGKRLSLATLNDESPHKRQKSTPGSASSESDSPNLRQYLSPSVSCPPSPLSAGGNCSPLPARLDDMDLGEDYYFQDQGCLAAPSPCDYGSTGKSL